MARRRHTPDQVIRKLREGEKLLGEGKDLAEACEHLEISGASWHRWRNQYGGMKADEAKRLRELERENGRLKKLVADQALDIDILKEVNRGNSEPGAQTPGGDYGFGAIRRFRATCMSRHRTTTLHAEDFSRRLRIIEHKLAVVRIAMGPRLRSAGCTSRSRSDACHGIAWCQPLSMTRLTNKSIALVGLGLMVPSAQQHEVLDLCWIAERVILHVVDLYRSRVNATGYLTSFISVFQSSSNN